MGEGYVYPYLALLNLCDLSCPGAPTNWPVLARRMHRHITGALSTMPMYVWVYGDIRWVYWPLNPDHGAFASKRGTLSVVVAMPTKQLWKTWSHGIYLNFLISGHIIQHLSWLLDWFYVILNISIKGFLMYQSNNNYISCVEIRVNYSFRKMYLH